MSHNPTDIGRDLTDYLEQVIASLSDESRVLSQVDRFITETSSICSDLQSRIDATTVAQVGLAAILSTYENRYGDEAASLDDVQRFQELLVEKEVQLSDLHQEMTSMGGAARDFLEDINQAQAKVDASLDAIEDALRGLEKLRRKGFETVALNKAKVMAVIDQYWPEGTPSSGPTPRINLPSETLHSVVDQVLGKMTPDAEAQQALLGQVLSSIRDTDLRTILSQKVDSDADKAQELVGDK